MSNTDKTTDIYNNRYFVARVLLDNVILFIGYCSFRNNKFQQCMRWGDDHNNLIRKLTQLPFDYFSKWQQKKILIPTLISITFENEKNREMLETELSTKHLVQFILRYHYTAFNRNHSQRNRNCVANVKKDGAESTFWNHAYDLEHRFPIELWPVAIRYYRNASRTENDTQWVIEWVSEQFDVCNHSLKITTKTKMKTQLTQAEDQDQGQDYDHLLRWRELSERRRLC